MKGAFMKYILCGVAFVMVCGLSAGITSAQQQWSKGAFAKAGVAYNPNIVYAGNFKADLLFCRYEGSDVWRRVNRLDRLRYVTCTDALQKLKQKGTWKGHLDVKDGSCGSLGEPLDWAMGNWINYNDQILQMQNNNAGGN